MRPTMTADLSWRVCRFSELTVHSLYAVLRLRDQGVCGRAGFGVRRYRQPGSGRLACAGLRRRRHLAGLRPRAGARGKRPAGRLHWPVVVAPAARGLGLGGALLDRALALAAERYPVRTLCCRRNCDKQGVYASRGFVAEGEPYDDGGIDHVTMRRAA